MEKENYNPYNDIKVIFDDKEVSMYEVLTPESAKYFGGDRYSDDWGSIYRNGDLYFVVDKIGDKIYSIFNQKNKPTMFYDVLEYEKINTPKVIYDEFPQLKEIMGELITEGETYELLKKVKLGYDPGWSDIDDELLFHIDFNEKNPGLSKVEIRFNDTDDYLDLFEDLEENDKYYFNLYNSNYYEPDIDRYGLAEEWDEGYIFNYLNDENQKKLELISLSTLNDKLPVSHMMKHIGEIFEDETEEISKEWYYLYDESIVDEIKKIMNEEILNKFSNFGIVEITPLYKYRTSVNVLLRLYDIINDKTLDIKGLLKEIIRRFDKTSFSYWGELYYQTTPDKFDEETFNRNASYIIDGMLEKLSDDEKYLSFEDYTKIISLVKDKYGFDKWNDLKKDNNIKFKIDSVDPSNNKLIVTIKNEKTGKEEKRSMYINDIPQLEYQYELFNENRNIVNENNQENINQKIRSSVEKFGLENALKMFGGNTNIIKRAYEDNPSSFLNQFNNLKSIVKDDKTFYVDEDNKPLFFYYQDTKNGYCYINYYRIWSFFEDIIGYNYYEIQEVMKEWLGETYNLGELTPFPVTSRIEITLGETYNLGELTPSSRIRPL